MTNYLKSRTIWLGIIITLLSAANAYFEIKLAPEIYSAIGVIIAALIAWLRKLTTTPLAEPDGQVTLNGQDHLIGALIVNQEQLLSRLAAIQAAIVATKTPELQPEVEAAVVAMEASVGIVQPAAE